MYCQGLGGSEGLYLLLSSRFQVSASQRVRPLHPLLSLAVQLVVVLSKFGGGEWGGGMSNE
jgi:hypothetical protein